MADTATVDTVRVARGARRHALRVRLQRLARLSRSVVRNPSALAGLIVIGLMLCMAVLAPVLVEGNTPDPYQMPRDWAAINAPPGTPGHPLGTTPQGGDVLYGIVWGSRLSVRLALTVAAITLTLGITLGSLAGSLGGRWDEYIMRVVDVFMSIPELILALAIAGILGPSFRNIILALAVTGWTQYARVIRGEILKVKQMEYVDSARLIGESPLRIYLRNILPNSLTPIVVIATLDMGKIVLVGATLSFIGLAETGLAEWGNLVSAGQEGVTAGRWWVATFGGAMVFLWALAFNMLGDGLRDVLDPKIEGR